MNNRLHNCTNPYQGDTKKVLCICSAGLLRSPTAAKVLWKEYGFNTRSAGIVPDFALIVLDEILLTWADEIVCMSTNQMQALIQMTDTPIICLNIEDSYAYMDPELQSLIVQNYKAHVSLGGDN